MHWIPDGTVTSPLGYSAGATACGLKALSLIHI